MGSPCLFTRQRALKLGYFYWLRIKNLNHLHTDLSLCYLKHTKFYVENRAPFIQISSIASFKPFLIDSSVVRLKSALWPKYTKYRTIFHKKSCSTIKLFFFFTYVLYWTVLSTCKYQKKNQRSPCMFPQTAMKGGHGFEIAVRIENLHGGNWDKIQNSAHRVWSMHSRSSLFSDVFMCLISPTQKFILGKSTKNTKEWGMSRFGEVLELWIFILEYFVVLAFFVPVS